MVVKGSKQYQSVVVPYRPLHRLCWIIGLTLCVGAIALGSFWLGYSDSQRDYAEMTQEWNQLHELTDKQSQQIEQLNQQVVNSKLGSTVDHQVVIRLQEEIVQLNEKIASLQQSNNFYRKAIDPNANISLAINSFKISATTKARRYHYELILQQMSADHRTVVGKVNVTLAGNLSGQPKQFSLNELTGKAPGTDLPLKLRFHQTLAGDFDLPEGFEPQRITVSAEKEGSNPVTADFDWHVKTQ